MRPTLAVVLPTFLCLACLPEPKTGCRTTDDCAEGRVCTAGICQAPGRDSGLEVGSDGWTSVDVAMDFRGGQASDLAGDSDGARDLARVDRPSDGLLMVDAPDNLARVDAPDSLAQVDAPDNLAPPLVGVLDAPVAPDAGSEGQLSGDRALDLVEGLSFAPPALVDSDAGSDSQLWRDAETDLSVGLGPDLAIDLAALAADVPPDALIADTIDAPSGSDRPQSMNLGDAGYDGALAICGLSPALIADITM